MRPVQRMGMILPVLRTPKQEVKHCCSFSFSRLSYAFSIHSPSIYILYKTTIHDKIVVSIDIACCRVVSLRLKGRRMTRRSTTSPRQRRWCLSTAQQYLGSYRHCWSHHKVNPCFINRILLLQPSGIHGMRDVRNVYLREKRDFFFDQ